MAGKNVIFGSKKPKSDRLLVFSKQQDILEALEIRFERVPEGLREEIESISDSKKLTHLHRTAITSADLESFAAEL